MLADVKLSWSKETTCFCSSQSHECGILQRMNSPKEKREFLSVLTRLMRADGIEAEGERLMLEATLDYLNITETDYLVLKKEPEEYHPPKSAMDRIIHFYQMSVLIKSDGIIAQKEVDYLNWLALRMGLRQEAVEAIIERLRANPKEILEPKVVIEIFQIFHN
jgi:murein L,D-transpeptidase YcbB/YkuD